MINEIKSIIELAPARQSQVFFRADIKEEDFKLKIKFTPTLDYYQYEKIGFRDPVLLFESAILHTGLAAGCVETWCKNNKKTYTITTNLDADTTSNYPNLCRLLKRNVNFIKEEVCSFIKNQIDNNLIQELIGYTYEEEKCHRDLLFLINAYLHDLSKNTNEKTRYIMKEFFDENGTLQVRKTLEIIAHNYLKNLVKDYITKNNLAPTHQNKISQYIDRSVIETEGIDKLNDLINSFISVLENGEDVIPTLITAPVIERNIEVTINV